MNPVTYESADGLGLLKIANPPVNAISPAVTEGVAQALAAFEADATARALVVYCDGRTFVAGGDIGSFELPGFSARPFNSLLARIEAYDRPVVAALHGTVLGGGLELAMACHHRVAQGSTRFGMPEVKLGLLPGSLGTQRLPRLAGVPMALDLIQSGRTIDARQALAAGVVDELDDGEPQAFGVAAARRLLAGGRPVRRASELACDS